MARSYAHARVWFGRVVLAIFVVAVASCVTTGRQFTVNLDQPARVLHVEPGQEWMDTGLTVRRDEWLSITATGAVQWTAGAQSVGPDGLGGYPGWNSGRGGLIGRVDGGKAFEIGARTTLFRVRNGRSRWTYPPPPLKMPADGHLWLGFKGFTRTGTAGSFEVTVTQAMKR